MPNLYKLMLSPRGRIGRKDFVLGLCILAAVVCLFNFILPRIGNSMIAFFLSLPFPFLVLHMVYCVYGKRAHDIGRSFWLVTTMLMLILAVMIGVMFSFGGTEYFSEFSQYSRENPPPLEVADAIRARYALRMVDGLPWLRGLTYGIIGLFSLGLTLIKPRSDTNPYG